MHESASPPVSDVNLWPVSEVDVWRFPVVEAVPRLWLGYQGLELVWLGYGCCYCYRSSENRLRFLPSFTPSALRSKPPMTLTARILWRCSSNTLTACPVQNHTRILRHRLRALTICSHLRFAASRASGPCRWRYIPRGQRGALAHHPLP